LRCNALLSRFVKGSLRRSAILILDFLEKIFPLAATALTAHIGDAEQFKNGRQMAAYLGITPREHSSGGKRRLLGITKRGKVQLRTLPHQGKFSSGPRLHPGLPLPLVRSRPSRCAAGCARP
jgi:transposase